MDIVLSPRWWHARAGITFDRDFFYHPARRVEVEQLMERTLRDRWGPFGVGSDQRRPEVGPVHLAAGYLLQAMLGCEVAYREDDPPDVIPAGMDRLAVDPDAAFRSPAFREFASLCDTLLEKHGYLTGDVNFAGILNIALDLRGEELFIDMHTRPEETVRQFDNIAAVVTRFVDYVSSRTSTSSISVNRNVRNLSAPVVLHSECTHTMISVRDYERFFMKYDVAWARRYPAFGVHFCGPDPHRFAAAYGRVPGLAFVDVGAGGDVATMRKHLPGAFLNLRLDPVTLRDRDPGAIRETVRRLAGASGDPRLTGICCINMDDTVTDEQVAAIFAAAEELRREG